MPTLPSGPLDIPNASGHSIGLSRQPITPAGTPDDELAEIIDFSTRSEALVVDEEVDEYESGSVGVVELPIASDALISVEAAAAKLGSEVLATLDDKFKGKLSEDRHVDERDLIF